MSTDRPLVVAIFGPTGVGKTAVGVEVARILGVRLISCDALQLYPDFPVLTNQPDELERAAVPHVLVGEQTVLGGWSAGRYARMARRLIDEDLASSGTALIAGGTGLYLRAALAPLAAAPPGDPDLRALLEERARLEGTGSLHVELTALDPAAAAAIHPHNTRRIVRALQVLWGGGAAAWSGREDLWRPIDRHPTLLVALAMDRSMLYERIDRRVRAMVVTGGLDEVRRYRERRQADDQGEAVRGVEQAIGYRELSAYLDGACTLEEAEEAMAAATRRYARRQLTWMRRLSDAVIIDISVRPPEEIAREVVALADARRSAGPEGGSG